MRSHKSSLIGLAVVVAVSIVFAGCSSPASSPETATETATATATAAPVRGEGRTGIVRAVRGGRGLAEAAAGWRRRRNA